MTRGDVLYEFSNTLIIISAKSCYSKIRKNSWLWSTIENVYNDMRLDMFTFSILNKNPNISSLNITLAKVFLLPKPNYMGDVRYEPCVKVVHFVYPPRPQKTQSSLVYSKTYEAKTSGAHSLLEIKI